MSMLAPDAPRARFLELTSDEWAVLVTGAALAVATAAYLRSDVTGWVVSGLFFSALVVGHLCMTARRYVAFPDLIAVAACLQWVIAPWLAGAYPPHMLVFKMTLPPTAYLSYALPATVAL